MGALARAQPNHVGGSKRAQLSVWLGSRKCRIKMQFALTPFSRGLRYIFMKLPARNPLNTGQYWHAMLETVYAFMSVTARGNLKMCSKSPSNTLLDFFLKLIRPYGELALVPWDRTELRTVCIEIYGSLNKSRH